MPVKPTDPKQGGGGGQGIKGKFFKGSISFLPVASLVFIISIMIYALFMNKATVFRDLFFFTVVFSMMGILFVDKYKSSFLKKQKTIYLFSSIFTFLFLLLIYSIYLIGGAEEYFNNTASDKLGAVLGFIIFFCILGIKLIVIKNERQE